MTSFRAQMHPRALGTALAAAGTLATPTSLPKFNLQGQPDALQHRPRLPLVVKSGGRALIREKAGGVSRSPTPEPILHRQLIDLQMSGESREKHKAVRDNQSLVAQDMEKRALQRAWLCFQAASTLFSPA